MALAPIVSREHAGRWYDVGLWPIPELGLCLRCKTHVVLSYWLRTRTEAEKHARDLGAVRSICTPCGRAAVHWLVA